MGRAWLLLGVMGSVGCSMEQVPVGIEPGAHAYPVDSGSTSVPITLDDTAVLSSIAGAAFETSAQYSKATRAPYASTAAVGDDISEWVTAAALATYDSISPTVTGSHASLPAGTTIVRQVLEPDGGVAKLTLMVKGPPGYNPDLGDWWFGETDPSGTPLTSDAGVLMGRLSQCYSCHLTRNDDGYLFGVPSSDRVTD